MIASDMLQAPDPMSFNDAAEQSGKPWRLSRRDTNRWTLIDASDQRKLLDLEDVHSDFEAVRRALAYLLSEGRL